MTLISSIRYQYGLFTVTGLFVVHDLDLELQAEVGGGVLPGVRVPPVEHLSVTAVQVGESFRPH